MLSFDICKVAGYSFVLYRGFRRINVKPLGKPTTLDNRF
jgi:hypothetical protein